jgi:triosephosphate isomerase (TIM)
MSFYCAGNWKLNKSPKEAVEFVQALKTAATAAEQANLVVFPPALSAYAVAAGLKDSAIAWGGQNCHSETKGAFTGENSPQVFKEMGARYCLVGHSERRHIFGETDEMMAKKVKALQALDVIPVLCVGETLDERFNNKTQEVIESQTRKGLALAEPGKPYWLAYEPVWAIGTGQVATPEQVEDAHALLRKVVGEKVPILYGGSVKPDNSATLARLNNVNGFLIGGASLIVDDFLKIYRGAQE